MDVNNLQMRKFLEENIIPLNSLNDDLFDILKEGFIQSKTGGMFFHKMCNSFTLEVANKLSGDELTDYENITNKIHIDDYCDSLIFSEAILFLDKFTVTWKENFPNMNCVASLSFQQDDEMGDMATFSFLIERGLPWFASDIENFAQPVFIRRISQPVTHISESVMWGKPNPKD